MSNKISYTTNIIEQTPKPKITIINQDTEDIIATFSLWDDKVIESYSFSLSCGDVAGSFSISFFPTNTKVNSFYHEAETTDYFDIIPIKSIVKIYEDKAENSRQNAKPIFIGIVASKKYSLQAGESGAVRKLTISGTSIVGLVRQFKVTFDVICLGLLNELGDAGVSKDFTEDIRKLWDGKKIPVDALVKTIWGKFKKIAAKWGTSKIEDYIENFLGEDFFEIDEGLSCAYPIGRVIGEGASEDFFSMIDSLLPSPMYEKTAYMTEDGKMKLRIRKAPFEKESWQGLKWHTIYPIQVKSIELQESDKEVYTVFYVYLSGYPLQEDKAIKSQIIEKKVDSIKEDIFDKEKFQVYGYRPLYCTLRGFSPSNKDKDKGKEFNIDDKLKEEAKKLKECYSHLDEMLEGSINLVMTYGEDKDGKRDIIMPGDKVRMLGGEFYVEGISHNWNYASSGSIDIAVSRGGDYTNGGGFKPLKEITKAYALYKEYKEVVMQTSK